ncbi:MAG TPA: OST-HTH/LOTUS domain-containing protein, partial [Sediminibacterium sp.]|nr:OST-HTH/LOTUS domain-containing protein [Sediminibacterium sp.]
PEIINDWNAMNAFNTKVLLMPVKWETHSAPLLGDRPQAIINEQLVKDCDLLVGVFWTRIGTNTGIAISGTAEEIEQFVSLSKPVMLYFSQSPVDPDKIDLDQFTVLRGFKEKMRLKGLTETYSNIPDFKQKFSRQLGINIGNIVTALPDKPKATAAAQHATTEATKRISPVTIKAVQPDIPKLTPKAVDEYLIKAMQVVADSTGWASIAAVGGYLKTYTPINYREFGYDKLKAFLKSRKIFEMKEAQKSPNAKNIDSAFIRLIPK